jgi:hypothetical protein
MSEVRFESTVRPAACPACGHSPVAEISYGYPAPSPELDEKLKKGTVVLGGCEITGDDPAWLCGECAALIYSVVES